MSSQSRNNNNDNRFNPSSRYFQIKGSNLVEGHCFPECDNDKIIESLCKLIPTINITKYNTGTFPELFQNFIVGLEKSKKNTYPNNIEDTTLETIHNKVDHSKSEFPHSIDLLFKSLKYEDNYDCNIVLPITSTSLAINSQLDHGWKANQSIFDFIKKQLGNSSFSEALGQMFGDFGKDLLSIGEKVTSITENIVHIFGRDMQLGPYWSIGEGALDNRQTLTFNTILVNDSYKHYIDNAAVMKKLFIESQPFAEPGFVIRPPSIFDVELNTHVAGKKKYFLCSGQFSCEAKGRYYIYEKQKIPEAYSLSLTFNSLIPDLLKIQEVKNSYTFKS